jgi:hypothetical protein
MGPLAGFIAGYLLGTKAGPESVEQIRKAWEVISTSEEFQGIRAMALGYLQNLLSQGGGELTSQIQSLVSGNGDILKALGDSDESLMAVWSKLSTSQEFQMLIASGTAMLGGVLAQSTAAFSQQSRGH